jgi:hypothetical protein
VCSQDSTRLGTPDCPVVHRTGSGGAPDSARCARPAPANWPLSGKLRRRTAIIHRTVRWCTGLSGEPTTVSSTVGRQIRGHAWPAPMVGRGTGLFGVHRTVSGAPTARNMQRSDAREKEGDRAPDSYSDCPVAHRTVRCATRQKARLAFQDCLQRLLATLGL